MPGPPPKRTQQRRRANKTDPITEGRLLPTEAPLADPEWHPLARDWFDSLANSGQSEYFQASDWQTGRVAAELLSRQLYSGRPSAQMVQVWASLSASLLMTEGDRRRARLELQSTVPSEEAGDVSWLNDARDRLRSG